MTAGCRNLFLQTCYIWQNPQLSILMAAPFKAFSNQVTGLFCPDWLVPLRSQHFPRDVATAGTGSCPAARPKQNPTPDFKTSFF